MMQPQHAGARRIPSVIHLLWFFSLAAVVFLSLKPSPELPTPFWNADKVGHGLAYLWLALLPVLVVANQQRLFFICIGLIMLGVMLEFGQIYVPGRSFSLADMVANTIGVSLGFPMGKYCRLRVLQSLL